MLKHFQDLLSKVLTGDNEAYKQFKKNLSSPDAPTKQQIADFFFRDHTLAEFTDAICINYELAKDISGWYKGDELAVLRNIGIYLTHLDQLIDCSISGDLQAKIDAITQILNYPTLDISLKAFANSIFGAYKQQYDLAIAFSKPIDPMAPNAAVTQHTPEPSGQAPSLQASSLSTTPISIFTPSISTMTSPQLVPLTRVVEARTKKQITHPKKRTYSDIEEREEKRAQNKYGEAKRNDRRKYIQTTFLNLLDQESKIYGILNSEHYRSVVNKKLEVLAVFDPITNQNLFKMDNATFRKKITDLTSEVVESLPTENFIKGVAEHAELNVSAKVLDDLKAHAERIFGVTHSSADVEARTYTPGDTIIQIISFIITLRLIIEIKTQNIPCPIRKITDEEAIEDFEKLQQEMQNQLAKILELPEEKAPSIALTGQTGRKAVDKFTYIEKIKATRLSNRTTAESL